MGIRIDKAGRIVVVPKPLRERLGFKPETELEAIEQPEGVHHFKSALLYRSSHTFINAHLDENAKPRE